MNKQVSITPALFSFLLFSATLQAQNLNNGLVAYWSFNEGKATDGSGNLNNGTLTGNVSFVDGVIGKAAKFGGFDNRGDIQVRNSASLQFQTEASFSLWVRVDDSFGQTWKNCSGSKEDNAFQMIFAKSGDRYGFVATAIVNTQKKISLRFTFHENGSTQILAGTQGTSEVQMGSWLHTVYLVAQSGTAIYVNGQLLARDSKPARFNVANNETLYWGIQAGKGSCLPWWYPLNGALDEIRVYNRALSEAEIKLLYQQGGLSNASPQILSVKDVPNDQGGRVTIKWKASSLDTNVSTFHHYSIWRALPEGRLTQVSTISAHNITEDFKGPAYRVATFNGASFVWEWLANQPAHRLPFYSYIAATLYDSMSTTDGKHYFLVSAHASDPNIFYDSNADSGYSVDNLAPVAPRNLVARYESGQIVLQWNPNIEPDLKHYVLYRSSSPNIDPDKLPSFATSLDARFVDNSPLPGNASYYVIRARDIHDNSSPKSNEAAVLRTSVLEREAEIPTAYALYQNHPNPFNPSTTIRYAIPKSGDVRLKIYNLLGKEMATLVSEKKAAGDYEVQWHPAGLPSGVYVYRLQAGQFVESKKLVLTQ